MNIGLDWDGTVTRDPSSWFAFVKLMKEAGHRVYIVTMRYGEQIVDGLKINECQDIPQQWLDLVDGLYPTNRQAKEAFMFQKGIRIDVWIDDNPKAVYQNAEQIWGWSAPVGHVMTPGEDVVDPHGGTVVTNGGKKLMAEAMSTIAPQFVILGPPGDILEPLDPPRSNPIHFDAAEDVAKKLETWEPGKRPDPAHGAPDPGVRLRG